MNKILIGHTIIFFVYFVVYLLYQFEVLEIDEEVMIRVTRFSTAVETIILIATRFVSFERSGMFALGSFYAMNIILLALQFTFANWGIGRKILDLMWISFYVILFLIDVCGIPISTIIGKIVNSDIALIDIFFRDSYIGEIIFATIVPVLKGAITEAIHRYE